MAVIAAVNAVIALVCYARVARTTWMDLLPEDAPDPASRTRPLSGSPALTLGRSVLFVIVAGVLPTRRHLRRSRQARNCQHLKSGT